MIYQGRKTRRLNPSFSLFGVIKTLKYKLFIGFRNGKVLSMVLTTAENYESAIDCDHYQEVKEGTEKQQLQEWLKLLETEDGKH